MITRTQFIDAGDQTGIVSEKALHRVRRGIPANNIYIPPLPGSLPSPWTDAASIRRSVLPVVDTP